MHGRACWEEGEQGRDRSLAGQGGDGRGGSVLELMPTFSARRKGPWVLLHRRTRGRADREKAVLSGRGFF